MPSQPGRRSPWCTMSSLRSGRRLLCPRRLPKKGDPEEEKKSSVQLKRGPGTAGDEPKAKKGSMSSSREPVKGIELKSASEVAMEDVEKDTQTAEKAKGSSESRSDTVEKRPHTPRSGLVLKSAEEVQMKDVDDPGEKAPHGDFSDEEDEQLAENLTKATSVVTSTPREGAGAVSGPRSDEVDYDEDELQSMITSSKVTIAELEGDARADSQASDHRPARGR